jgi:hypothetical protein
MRQKKKKMAGKWQKNIRKWPKKNVYKGEKKSATSELRVFIGRSIVGLGEKKYQAFCPSRRFKHSSKTTDKISEKTGFQ